MRLKSFLLLQPIAFVAAPLMLFGGVAHAEVKTGVDAWSNGDYTSAVNEWRQPALDGDADAQFNMGQAYRLGRGVELNLDMALEWFGKASRQGHIKASDNYGLVLFQMGRRDDAMPYIEKSVARGEPRAQYILGTALFNGQLAKKDWVRAYALMTRASAAGIPAATRSLTQMDQYIPLDQRQQGTAMAGKLEKQEASSRETQMAGFPVSTAKPAPVAKPVALPPSKAPAAPRVSDLAGYTPSVGAAAEKPASDNIGTSYPAPDIKTMDVTGDDTLTSSPTPAPLTKAAPVISDQGTWRIQLAATGSQQEAKAYADKVEAKVPQLSKLQYFLDMSAPPYVRLQAGSFASKADADKMCGTVKAAGFDCFSRQK